MAYTARGEKCHFTRTATSTRTLCGVKVEKMVTPYGKNTEPIPLTDVWLISKTNCINCLMEHER